MCKGNHRPFLHNKLVIIQRCCEPLNSKKLIGVAIAAPILMKKAADFLSATFICCRIGLAKGTNVEYSCVGTKHK